MNDLSFLVVPLPEEVKREIILGNFEGAKRIMRRLLQRDVPQEYALRLEYEMERLKRMQKDFSLTREDALKLLNAEIEEFKPEEFDYWISKGLVERIFIDGEERYFDRFIANLFFQDEKIKTRRKREDELSHYSRKIIRDSVARINSGDIRKYRIVAGIKVKMKRRGQYRVWLPIPKENFQIEKVRIISAKPGGYYIADNDALQRTIYFDATAKKFSVEFEYIISEVRGGIDGKADVEGNRKEKSPHVRFTPYIKSLAKKIVGDAEDDYEKARRIYQWMTRNTNYTYVREYCLYDNISEFVATSLRGDCGMFALLFITLCRAVGIAAKWQSGWFITPKFASPHDWAQVYVDGSWLPVDASFGNYRRHGKRRNDFYFGNIDAFRMIANDDFLTDFHPEKKYWRSDPVDNQRGEVENERRNLYFDEFESHMYVKSFERL
jgi:transglutaminase-like putative cysteine protease